MQPRRLQRRRSFEATCCAIQQRTLRLRQHRPAPRSSPLGVGASRRPLGRGQARPGVSVNLQLGKRRDLSRNPPCGILKKEVLNHSEIFLTGWVGYFQGGWFGHTWPDSWSGARTRRGVPSRCRSARFQARCARLVSLFRGGERKV